MIWPHFARRCRVCAGQPRYCCARRATKGCKAAGEVLYFDTSFLAPLIVPEPHSDEITAFVGRLPAEEFTVSHWTRLEFSSLVAREVRMGGMGGHTAKSGAVPGCG